MKDVNALETMSSALMLMFNVLVKKLRGLNVDDAHIDAQTIPVAFDESHIDCDTRRQTIDVAFIGREVLRSRD